MTLSGLGPWARFAFLVVLLNTCFSIVSAQKPSWEYVDSLRTDANKRGDRLWFYGGDHYPIISQLIKAQELACEAGYEDLYILSFADLSYVYELKEMPERYEAAVMQGWAEARSRLPEKNVERAVMKSRWAHYCWNEVPELEDSTGYWLHEVAPLLKSSRYMKARFGCFLDQGDFAFSFSGDADAAFKYFQAAQKTAKNLPTYAEEQFWLNYQLNVYYRTIGKLSMAIHELEVAIKLIETKRYRSRADSVNYSGLLNNLGVQHRENGELQKAIILQEKAIEIDYAFSNKTRADSAILAIHLNNLASMNQEKGELQKAILNQEKSLEIKYALSNKTRADSVSLATSLNNLASMNQENGELQKAIILQEKSLAISYALSSLARADSVSLATSLNNLASINRENGELQKAIIYQEKALVIEYALSNKTRADSAYLSTSLNNLSILHEEIGAIEKAIQASQKALSISYALPLVSPIERNRLARSLNNLGTLLEENAEHSKAVFQYQNALEIIPEVITFEIAETKYVILLNLSDKADTLVAKERQASYLQMALDIANRWKMNPYQAYKMMGDYYRRHGDFQLAIESFQKAIKNAETIYQFPNPELANIEIRFGNTYLEMGSFSEALSHLLAGLSHLSAIAQKPWSAEAPSLERLQQSSSLIGMLSKLSMAHYAITDSVPNRHQHLQKNLQYFLLSDSAAQRQRNAFSGRSTRLQTSRNAQSIYTGTIRSALDLNDLQADAHYQGLAFSASEKAKGLTLLQSQWEAQAHHQAYLPDSLLLIRSLLLEDLHRMENKLRAATPEFGQAFDTLTVSYLQNAVFALTEKLEKWKAEVAIKYPDYENRLKKDFAVMPEEVAEKLLGAKEALIEFSIGKAERFGKTQIGEDELYTFVITKAGLQTNRQAITADFEQHIRQVQRALSDYSYVHDSVAASYATYTQSAHALYQILLAPILSAHPGLTKLIIVPDGELNRIPFEALLTKPAPIDQIDFQALPYLIKEHEISYAYSAHQLLEIQQSPRPISAKGLLAFAPGGTEDARLATRGNFTTMRSNRAENLPGATEEIRQLSDMGLVGDYFFGDSATENQFKKLAANYGVLYLAQHGLADAKDPTENRLAFAHNASDTLEDGLLHSYELAGLKLNADLAVLSACETGAVNYLQGEGVASLGRDFIAAGVRAVVMTLWQVEDKASSKLMQHFFERIAAGIPSGQALHQAKLDFLNNSDSRTAHPFYWAGYIANGASEPVTLAKESNWKWFFGISVGVLGLLGLVFWVWRRGSLGRGL